MGELEHIKISSRANILKRTPMVDMGEETNYGHWGKH